MQSLPRIFLLWTRGRGFGLGTFTSSLSATPCVHRVCTTLVKHIMARCNAFSLLAISMSCACTAERMKPGPVVLASCCTSHEGNMP